MTSSAAIIVLKCAKDLHEEWACVVECTAELENVKLLFVLSEWAWAYLTSLFLLWISNEPSAMVIGSMFGISLFVLCTALAMFARNSQQSQDAHSSEHDSSQSIRSRSLLFRRTRPEPTGGYTIPLTT